jgi:hypothetical protein
VKVIRGSCSRCGQCCGKDTNVPAFGWGFWEICLQTVDNPDFPETALPRGQRTLFNLVRSTVEEPLEVHINSSNFILRLLRIGGEDYNVFLKSDIGLVTSDEDHSCPFVLEDGSCGVWSQSWCVALCHSTYPQNGFVLPDEDETYLAFFDRHPSCTYYVSEE